jgi:hypothetical protein
VSTTAAQQRRKPRRGWPRKPYRPNQGILSTQARELKARAKVLAIATNTNVNRLLRSCLSEPLDAIEQALEEAARIGAEDHERKGET